MSELIGTWAEKREFKRRLEEVRPHKDALIMGRVGRTALEWALNWPKKYPLMLLKHEGVWADIDVLFPYKSKPPKNDRNGRFTLDYGMGLLLEGGSQPYLLSAEHSGVKVPISQEILTPRLRRFAGTDVRTLSAGSHFLIEALLPYDPEQRIPRNIKHMAEFTRWARQKHPDEFLPSEHYEPYFAFAKKIGRDLSPLLPR